MLGSCKRSRVINNFNHNFSISLIEIACGTPERRVKIARASFRSGGSRFQYGSSLYEHIRRFRRVNRRCRLGYYRYTVKKLIRCYLSIILLA